MLEVGAADGQLTRPLLERAKLVHAFEIDRRFRTDLNRFVDARESLTHIYGLQAYADIMSAFAAGERYLNRVWSASADGYADEARDYIGRARSQFEEARAKLEEIHARAAPG